MNIIIVGAGLFGTVAADLARSTGHSVTIFDCEQPGRASKCSGNTTRSSWLTSLPEGAAPKALETLASLYPFITEDFTVLPDKKKKTALSYVPRKELLRLSTLAEKGKVEMVGNGFVRVRGRQVLGKVLVCAGVWSCDLVDMPPIRWLAGSSMIAKGTIAPVILPWAPYKQAIAYNYARGQIWAGDGAAILQANFHEDRIDSMRLRAIACGVACPTEVNIGYRPYIPGYKNGYFAQVYKNTWVATGGAKNGMVLAAHHARQFLEAIS